MWFYRCWQNTGGITAGSKKNKEWRRKLVKEQLSKIISRKKAHLGSKISLLKRALLMAIRNFYKTFTYLYFV